MSELRILFTGVGRRVELLQAFREAALVLNKNVKLYGADMAGTAPALAYCDYTRRVVGMKDPQYIENLIEICKTDDIDLVIPTIDTDLLVLSEHKNEFENIGTKVLISDSDKIKICRDKNNTSQFFIDCGLKAPLPVNDWKKYDSGFPAFIKPKDGSSSINAYKVNDIDELEMYANQVDDYIVQPFVDGSEYTIDIFCDWVGNPLSIVPRERVQVRAGEVLKTQITMDTTMIEEARCLCEFFKPCGPLTVQLIRDSRTSEDYYIEINPRFGGGAPLSMKAGARSAESILRLLSNEVVEPNCDIEDGAIYSRFDQSVCIKSEKVKINGVIFDLDDTLYSEKEYIKSGFHEVSEYLGGEYENELWSNYELGKKPIDELLNRLNRMDEKETVLSLYRDHFPVIHLYKGAKETIDYLLENGFNVGIITDGRPRGQRNKISALGLDKTIDDIIITDELGGTQFRKPCDIAFRILQTRWKIPVNRILYVADNLGKDIQAPIQLGMKFLWFRNSDGIYNIPSDKNIDSISDCKDIIRYLGKV